MRTKIIAELIKHVSFPELFELLIDDLIRLNLRLPELVKIAIQSLGQRFYDLKYKQKLEKLITDSKLSNLLKRDIELISTLKGSKSNIFSKHKRIRILLYFYKNVHIPILLPIYNYLKLHYPEIQLAFGYMQYAPQIRAGFTEEELGILKSFGESLYLRPQEFEPDITIIADSAYQFVQNCGKIIHIGHGILSKGQYYTDTELARREESADLVCVPGEYHKKIMDKIITKAVAATGMAKLDDLFSGKINRESVLDKYKLPADYKYILFAPTFNDELSAIPFIHG